MDGNSERARTSLTLLMGEEFLNAFVFVDISDTAEEGSILCIAQIADAVGFHAWNEDETIRLDPFLLDLFTGLRMIRDDE